MTSISRTIQCLAACAGLALAQGAHSNRGGMNPSGGQAAPNSNLAMTNLQTVTGPVTAVNIAYGMQYPSITINKLQVKVAPAWYLLEQNFPIKVGDTLTVVAAPSIVPSDAYLYAIQITNTATSAQITLRDAAGLPLWVSQAGIGIGAGSGSVGSGSCTQIATESGTIEQITTGVGIQMPSLTLKTANGKLLLIQLGPERILLAADLELKAGDSITVRYAVTAHDDELVALSITEGATTITLRGDDCRPLWN